MWITSTWNSDIVTEDQTTHGCNYACYCDERSEAPRVRLAPSAAYSSHRRHFFRCLSEQDRKWWEKKWRRRRRKWNGNRTNMETEKCLYSHISLLLIIGWAVNDDDIIILTYVYPWNKYFIKILFVSFVKLLREAAMGHLISTYYLIYIIYLFPLIRDISHYFLFQYIWQW